MSPLVHTPFGRVRSDWQRVPLSDVAFFQEGPGLRKWQWTDAGMKVINGTNVLPSGEFDVNNTSRFISLHEFANKYQHFAVEPDDIVVVSSGSIGKVSRVRVEHLPLMMNTSVVRFHPLDVVGLDADYLFGFLRSPLFQAQASSFAIGTAQLNFGPSHIKQMWIPLPPMSEQRKVGSVLSAYDALIDNNTRRIKILEEMAQAIYREWFVEFRYPGHENVPLFDSELGPIPEGWEWRPLFEVAEPTFGFPFKSKLFNTSGDGTPIIRIRDVPKNRTGTFTTEVAAPQYEVEDGDLLIGMDGDFHMGRWSAGSAYLNQRVVRFRPSGDSLSRFQIYLALQRPIRELNGSIVGTTVAHLGKRHLEPLRLLVPRSDLRNRAREVFDSMFDLVIRLHQATANLRTTRDLLLPRLISGEIDASNLNIDLGEVAA